MKSVARAVSLSLALAVLGVTAAQAGPSSGMLLGVRAFPNARGLRVVDTIPGYPAEGRIFAGDVLIRVSDGVNTFPVRTSRQIERAKDLIGPYQRVALELYRPYVGNVYLWVTFVPVGGSVHARGGEEVYAAEIQTEEELPGAEAFFFGGDEQGAFEQGDGEFYPQDEGGYVPDAGGFESDDPSSFFPN